MPKLLLKAVYSLFVTLTFIVVTSTTTAIANETHKLNFTGTITIAYIPAVTYPYVWQAKEAGYFSDKGLDVKLKPMTGGLSILRAIEGGSVQFGGSDVMGAISAVNSGVPVRYIVAPSYAVADHPIDAIMTNDPSVQSASDLKGKTLAVNLKYNIDWVLVREWLAKNGVNPDTVRIVEIPFPDMPDALERQTVDAAAPIEPFVTISQRKGIRNLGYYWAETSDKILESGIVGNTGFMDKYPEATRRIMDALYQAIKDISDNPEISRNLLRKYTSISSSLAKEVNLPKFIPNSDLSSSFHFWIKRAKAEGLVPKDKKIELISKYAKARLKND